jgi:hypothetical protein
LDLERETEIMNTKTPLCALALLTLLFWAAPPAHAAGVTTCTDSSKGNTSVMSCLSALVYAPLPIAQSTLVLICPQGNAGLQDQSQCPGNVWRPLSSVKPSDLIGYCAQAQLTPYTACDYPNGKEGYAVASSIGLGGNPTPPVGSATGAAQISWAAPTNDSAGNPVSITGYLIQYGTTDFAYSVSLNASVTTYTFNALAAGTWQFRVIALDAAGQSAPSAPVTLVIAGDTPSCGPAPATATQAAACPTGTAGTWTQTHGWTAAPYPTCWTANAWGPTSAPAGACTTVATTWKTTAAESVFEAVLPVSGTALIQGNNVGTVAADKPCGDEQYKIGTASYRRITDADASLKSPTYAGRINAAVCTQH